MIRNYVLIAVRNIQRQWSYSLINIFGLAIGIACSLVMFLYVYNEWSYDRHYKNADRIYKIGISFFNSHFAIGPEVLGEYLPKEFEGVEAFTRVKHGRNIIISDGAQSFTEPMVYYTDNSFFSVFSYEFLQGNPRSALEGPGIVMTSRMAEKYFKGAQALGKTLEIGKSKKPFTVTGIVKDDTRSSQLKASIWISIDDELTHEAMWTSAAYHNYVLLKENNVQADLEVSLGKILEKHVYPHASGVPPNISFEDYKKNENSVKFFVSPLTDIHLKSKLNYEISPGGSESNMYAFGAISFFILLLASVNFINLTTARASRRAKEVGIRKVAGSSRGRLVIQFTLESVIVTMTATALSLGLADLFLNVFEFVTGEKLINTLWSNYWSVLFLIALALIVGVLSGVYPAFYLTSFKPVQILKGNLSLQGRGSFRNYLVVFQFSISICLMICSGIVVKQMNFMQNKDLGFTQGNMVTIDKISLLKDQVDAFKNELTRLAGVTKASLHTGEPGSKITMTITTFRTAQMTEEISINTYFGDADYIDIMGYRLLKGRGFNKDLASDTASVILNESAVRALGLEDPLNAIINSNLKVIGVVSDFHWESLRNRIAPVAIMQGTNYYQLGLRLEGGSRNSFLEAAEKKWKNLLPGEPFRYHFLDDNFGDLLKQEEVFGKAIGFFTVLAIFISCLGLYGLSAYTAEQRTKEIGIRKVLGATASNIVGMLNKRFALLVFISILIATPTAAYLMLKWMEGFAYRAELELWIFAGTAAAAFGIALLTVSFHSLRAALINPADTLKYE